MRWKRGEVRRYLFELLAFLEVFLDILGWSCLSLVRSDSGGGGFEGVGVSFFLMVLRFCMLKFRSFFDKVFCFWI